MMDINSISINLTNINLINIEKYRKEKGISQKLLARKCNITQSYLSRIENYKEYPSMLVLINLSHNLEVCPNEFTCIYVCNICKNKYGTCFKNFNTPPY